MNTGKIEKHVNSGELLQTGLEFVCNICSSPLGQQPLQHIQGSSHKNAVFLQTLNQPSKYRDLYNDLSKVVLEAHSKGVVTVKDSKFECGPCNMSFSGEKPLTDHLNSSKHRTKSNVNAVPQKVSSPPTAGPSTAQPAFLPPSSSSSSSSGLVDPVVVQAIREDIVKANGSEFQCTLCPDIKVIVGVEPLKQHLNGKSHKKSLQEREVQRAGQHPASEAPIQPQQQPPINQAAQLIPSLSNLNITVNVQTPTP